MSEKPEQWHVVRKTAAVRVPGREREDIHVDLWQTVAVHPCSGGRVIINCPGSGGSHDCYNGKHREIARWLWGRGRYSVADSIGFSPGGSGKLVLPMVLHMRGSHRQAPKTTLAAATRNRTRTVFRADVQ